MSRTRLQLFHCCNKNNILIRQPSTHRKTKALPKKFQNPNNVILSLINSRENILLSCLCNLSHLFISDFFTLFLKSRRHQTIKINKSIQLNKHMISMCELSSYKCEMIRGHNCVVETEKMQHTARPPTWKNSHKNRSGLKTCFLST